MAGAVRVNRRRRLLDVQDADQGEQAAGSVEIHLDLAGEAFLQELGRLVVQAAPGHVDRLDAPGAVVADGAEIGIADLEIVADRAAEAGEAHADRLVGVIVLAEQFDGKAALLDAELHAIGAVMAGHRELVVLDQVEDRDPALLLDIGVALQDGALVQLDVDDAGIGHEGLLASAAFLRQRSAWPRFFLIHTSSTGLLA